MNNTPPYAAQPQPQNPPPAQNFDPHTGQPLNPQASPAQNFDPHTGAPINPQAATHTDPNAAQQGQPGDPNAPAPAASGNNMLAILSYLGILVVIPMVVTPKSDFVRFHNRQGLALIGLYIINIIVSIVSSFATALLPRGIATMVSLPLGLLSTVIGIVAFVFTIIGIVNVASKKQKELPIIGKAIADKLPANWG